MLDNTCNIFIIWSVEGEKSTIFDSYEKNVDKDNPLFGHINGAPRFGITIHATLDLFQPKTSTFSTRALI